MKARLQQLGERHALTVVALALAGLLKRFYSQASAEELRFILLPTSWLTSLGVDTEFAFRAGQGYLSREESVLISPACAGVNFLIVAFVSLVVGFSGRFVTLPRRSLWLVASAAIAFLTTLVVNALRISLSIALAHLATRYLGLTFQSVHRLLGVSVYLAGLLGLCLTSELWLSSRGRPARARGAFGRSQVLLLALGCYAGVTLLVPLLRGAGQSPEYWSHAAPVSVLVVVSAALLFAVGRRNWDDGRHAIRSPEHPERVASEQGAGG
ncbi:MAG TPA: exosortase K, partial [Polyangiaceae bacterium]|nr:exosortase K [Polyangiaceae bacterium]